MKGDVCDQAQDQIEKFNDQSVQRARKKAAAVEQDPRFDGETCIVCGIDIPAERIALKKIRCVECQTLLERKRR